MNPRVRARVGAMVYGVGCRYRFRYTGGKGATRKGLDKLIR